MGDRIVQVDATVTVGALPQGTTIEGFRFLYVSVDAGGGYPFSLVPETLTGGIVSHFVAEAYRGTPAHREPGTPFFEENPANVFNLRLSFTEYAGSLGELSEPAIRPGTYTPSVIQIDLKSGYKEARQFLWRGLDFGADTYPEIVIPDPQVNKPVKIAEMKASVALIGRP